MERLTSPNINVDPGTDRFLHAAIGGKEIDWKQSRDSTLNVMINGPTSNGFGKDIFRKMARDLYGRLITEDAMINLAAQALGVEADRLCELAEADKDGRLVVLPCKVGDTVWIVGAVRKLYSAKVRTFFCGHTSAVRGGDDDGHIHMIRTTECDIPMQKFGKTVFLSREEAEKDLQETEGKS